MKNRTLAFNRDNEVYVIYLHAAHVFPDDTYCDDPFLVALCPRCHHRFDHPRSEADWYYASLFFWQAVEKGAMSLTTLD